MHIFIKRLVGSAIAVEVEQGDSISVLKQRINSISNIPPEQQGLMYRGSLLDDSKTLAELGIEDQANIHLIVRLKDTWVTHDFETTDAIDIYFVPYMTSQMYKFSISTLSITLVNEIPRTDMGYGSHLIRISANKIFIHGGFIIEQFLPYTYSLDLNNFQIERKSDGPHNGAGARVKIEYFIYTFGGAVNNRYTPSAVSHKYDIRTDKWIAIAPLPQPSFNNCAAYFNSTISITGQHLPYICSYSQHTDTYAIGISLSPEAHVMLTYDAKIFIVFNTVIKVYEDGQWRDYPNNVCGNSCIVYSYPVCREDFIYYVIPPRSALRLNVKTKQLTLVAT